LPRKILLADDSVTAQNMGRRILTEAGYEVITVNNGAAAMKKISEIKPDLVVLDVHMPGYGGLEICQRLREMPKLSRIPVLLTVGKLEPFRPDDARRVNADAFVIKPFEATELLAVLTRLEDKIVPSMPDFGDDDSGWRNRLRIPAPYMKREDAKHEPAEETRSSLAAEETERQAEKTKIDKVVVIDAPVEEVPKEPVVEVASAEPQSEKAKEIQAEESAVEDAPSASFASAPTAVSDVVFAARNQPAPDEVFAALNTLAPADKDRAEQATVHKPDDDETQEYLIGAVVQERAQTGGPRWTANEILVTDEESTLVLELEMQRAYAAFAAADAARSAFQRPQSEPDEIESTVPPIETEQAASRQAETAPAAVAGGNEDESIHSEVVAAKLAPYGSPEEVSNPLPHRNGAEAVPENEQKAAYAVAAAGAGVSASAGLAEVEATNVPEVTPAAEAAAQPNQELATAWEQWKQVRNSLAHCESPAQFEKAATEHLEEREPATAALKTEEDSAAEASEIANIVDSVLADLKPRLMEEISRKMGKGKKK
jgi:CheY-like chemotaxis protein